MQLTDRQKRWAYRLGAGGAVGGAVATGIVVSRKLAAARVLRNAAEEYAKTQREARRVKTAASRIANKGKRLRGIATDFEMAARGMVRNSPIVGTAKVNGHIYHEKTQLPGAPWVSLVDRHALLAPETPKGGRPKGTGKRLSKPRKKFGEK